MPEILILFQDPSKNHGELLVINQGCTVPDTTIGSRAVYTKLPLMIREDDLRKYLM